MKNTLESDFIHLVVALAVLPVPISLLPHVGECVAGKIFDKWIFCFLVNLLHDCDEQIQHEEVDGELVEGPSNQDEGVRELV